MRLLLPGYEGNMNVKWLRRIKLTEGPTMTKDETSKYTILQNDGKSLQFCFAQEAKSVITRPSPGLTMGAPGLYEITGLAWSGYGRIAKVEVSADGGASWAPAALQEPVLPMAVTRFRSPWRWDGGPATASEPCDRRFRIRAADAVQAHRRSRRQGAPTISTGLPAGASHKAARSNMSTRNTLLAACSALVVGYGAALAESPNLGKARKP